MRPELLVYNPSWIANNQRNIVINLRQGFVASTHSDFNQGQTDTGLFYWPNITGKLSWLNKKKKFISAILYMVNTTKALTVWCDTFLLAVVIEERMKRVRLPGFRLKFTPGARQCHKVLSHLLGRVFSPKDTRGLYYKTFYGCNLRIFVIS